MNIEIITTPSGALKETGFGPNASCLSVLDSILRTDNMATLTVCSNMTDLEAVVARKPDVVFLAAKYLPVCDGENIWFSDYFSKFNITCSGSDRTTVRYDSNKVLAKNHLHLIGISTARHFTAIPHQFHSPKDLPLDFPLFIKPEDAANGNGIDNFSLVNNFEEYEAKVESIFKMYGQPALVEEFLGGREFTIAVIRKANGELATSAIEILPPLSASGLRILGEEVKRNDSEFLMTIKLPADLSNVTEMAEAAFIGLGIRGFGRIDVKMNEEGKCFFMEANLVPGMTLGSSYFPKAFEIAGNLNYDEVVGLMLDECLHRAKMDIAFSTLPQIIRRAN
jgi:D-alanine-D-alanine ligase